MHPGRFCTLRPSPAFGDEDGSAGDRVVAIANVQDRGPTQSIAIVEIGALGVRSGPVLSRMRSEALPAQGMQPPGTLQVRHGIGLARHHGRCSLSIYATATERPSDRAADRRDEDLQSGGAPYTGGQPRPQLRLWS
jgi:hypothetical protein